jgi:hypothetical protein
MLEVRDGEYPGDGLPYASPLPGGKRGQRTVQVLCR